MSNSVKANIKGSEESLETKTIKDVTDSLAKFFSFISGIILALSMSYSIGYFKYINPQFVELLKIGDYFNEAAHNVWLFVIAILLFFSSSIAFVKKRIAGKFEQTIMLGIFTLLACSYTFFRGISYTKFWPVIKFFLKDNMLMPLFLFVLLASIGIATFIVYKISFRVTETRGAPLYYVNLVPVLTFFIIVFAPYLAGVVQGYLESTYLTKEDYKFQLVSIVTLPNLTQLENVLVVRQIDRGLILRQFESDNISKSSYSFLNWGAVKQITFQDAYQATQER